MHCNIEITICAIIIINSNNFFNLFLNLKKKNNKKYSSYGLVLHV